MTQIRDGVGTTTEPISWNCVDMWAELQDKSVMQACDFLEDNTEWHEHFFPVYVYLTLQTVFHPFIHHSVMCLF